LRLVAEDAVEAEFLILTGMRLGPELRREDVREADTTVLDFHTEARRLAEDLSEELGDTLYERADNLVTLLPVVDGRQGVDPLREVALVGQEELDVPPAGLTASYSMQSRGALGASSLMASPFGGLRRFLGMAPLYSQVNTTDDMITAGPGGQM
jgi:hypothetical protein